MFHIVMCRGTEKPRRRRFGGARTIGGAIGVRSRARRSTHGFRHLPFNDVDALESAVRPETIAILVEPIQGEGGANVATPEFLRALRRVSDERGLLLCFDEVQCGLARAGSWNGWQSILPDGLLPDAISWAKGLGGGLPIGAVWIRKREVHTAAGAIALCDLFGPGTHATTFGGSPLVASAALAVLDVIARDRLVDNARLQGERALDALRAIGSPLVRGVRGRGLLVGIELDPGGFPIADRIPPSLQLIRALHAHGLLAPAAGPNVVRWLPPLNVSAGEIDRAATLTAEALAEIASARGSAPPKA